ncbi:MAG: Uma2 family endonuclease [Phototrophicaceae bacterium]|jgi:Uma2 family endonuclease
MTDNILTLDIDHLLESPSFVDEQTYLDSYAAHHFEWVEGRLIRLSPLARAHHQLDGYLFMLLTAYFTLRPLGEVLRHPFILKLSSMKRFREPDLMVILKSNPNQATNTQMIGAPDICIEIISPESVERDTVDKLREYEAGGVTEYWLFDPAKQTSRFYRLDTSRHYQEVLPDATGNYATPLLPDLKLHVPTLWQTPLPDIFAIVRMVEGMLTSTLPNNAP